MIKIKEVHKKNSKVYHLAKGKNTLCGLNINSKFLKWNPCIQCVNPGLCECEKSLCKSCSKKIKSLTTKEYFDKPNSNINKKMQNDSERLKIAERVNEIMMNSGFSKGPQDHELIAEKIDLRRKELIDMGIGKNESYKRAYSEFFDIDIIKFAEETNNENVSSFDKMAKLITFMESSSFYELKQKAKNMAIEALTETFDVWEKDCLNGDNQIADFEYFYRIMKIREMLEKL